MGAPVDLNWLGLGTAVDWLLKRVLISLVELGMSRWFRDLFLGLIVQLQHVVVASRHWAVGSLVIRALYRVSIVHQGEVCGRDHVSFWDVILGL